MTSFGSWSNSTIETSHILDRNFCPKKIMKHISTAKLTIKKKKTLASRQIISAQWTWTTLLQPKVNAPLMKDMITRRARSQLPHTNPVQTNCTILFWFNSLFRQPGHVGLIINSHPQIHSNRHKFSKPVARIGTQPLEIIENTNYQLR